MFKTREPFCCVMLLMVSTYLQQDLIACAPMQNNSTSPAQLADIIVERVLQRLKDLGRVPRDFARNLDTRPAVWTLSRTTNALVGREREVKVVLAALRRHGAAVVWGGPGEGKTTVAMEAARRLRAKEPQMTALALDVRGERAAVASCCRCWRGEYLTVYPAFPSCYRRSGLVLLLQPRMCCLPE